MAEKLLVLLALFALARPALGAKIVASVTDDAGQPVEDAVVFVYGEADGPFKGREMPYEMDQVDKTFVPALVTASNSKDPRELGVRVFHAFVDAR